MDGIRIYRGINQIGGIVTEIRKDDHRILIDLGANLPGTENAEKSDDALIREVFSRDAVRTDAIFFTHYHGDHVGLKSRVPEGIPMYAGSTALRIMKLIAERVDTVKKKNGRAAEAELPVLRHIEPYWRAGSFRSFDGIRVMPLICDHSALDAYMFVIELNGKRILYTGDFRAHGVPGKETFRKLITQKVGKVDLLITEGTMVSRVTEENPVRTEKDLRERAEQIFAAHKENVVLVSSTNLDSVMNFYRAVPRDKVFLCDPYQAHIMKIAIEARHRYFPETYSYRKHIFVLCPEENEYVMRDLAAYRPDRKLRSFGKKTETAGGMQKPFLPAKPERYLEKGFVMLARPNRNPAVKPGRFEARMAEMKDPFITYSVWSGYRKGGKAEDPAVVGFLEGHEDRIEELHTSGHAYTEDLRELMDMTSPERIIPMHTESTESFRTLEVFRDYKEKIEKLRPGELYPVG